MTCPNCGREFEGDRCPQCGRPVQGSGGRTAAIVLIILAALPCGLFGACSAFLGWDTVAGPNPFLWVGLASFAVATGIVVLAVRLWRK